MSNPIHRRSVDRFMAMVDGREEVSVLASEYDALESENEALRSQLTDALNRQTCEGGQPYVCHALATARSRLAEAEVLIAKGLAVVHDFLPNIGRCVLQDYQRMNEFCCEAAARAADSATHRENDA